MGSGESASPTNSIGSSNIGFSHETDSGHNSISSCYDSHSTSSQGSANFNHASTPPQTQRMLLQNRYPGKCHI